MTFLTGPPISLGDAALIGIGGIDCMLVSLRRQAFNVDLFIGLGCDITQKKIVVAKSAQYFHAFFSTVARHVVYVSPRLVHAEMA
jgi:microcystin degradation protein MlrC